MARRTLQELNLLDDFLFGSVLTHPGIGEEFSRVLLKVIFHRDFGKLKVIPQKVFFGRDTDKHGARLDVYLEETPDDEALETATIYDVEPNLRNKAEEVKALPKRMRFYHSVIDSVSLESGMDYQSLKRVVVIMIVPFDPFGYDHMVYTVSNRIIELPDADYEDGAKTLFLYTKGKKGKRTEELAQLLEYMEHSTEENVKNETLKKIHHMVETVKHDKGVSIEYMKSFERERELIEKGRKLEQENTEKERARADAAEKEVERLKAELEKLKTNL